MALSTFLRNALLDHYLGGSAYTQPTPKISLHTADPGITGANEVTGGSYVRKLPTFSAAASGSKASSADIDFTGMPACTVTHVGIWDATSAGNFLQGGALAASKVVNVGDTFRLTQPNLVASLT